MANSKTYCDKYKKAFHLFSLCIIAIYRHFVLHSATSHAACGQTSMKEIDEMDMLGFLRLRAWDAQREAEKKKPKHAYIDEVWGSVKP